MKTWYSLSLLIALIIAHTAQLPLYAQKTPEAFLSQLPSVPTVKCDCDHTEVDKFYSAIYPVKEELKNIIERMQESTLAKAQNSEDEIKANALDKAGISQAEMEKMAAMSDAELQQWAQNYANKEMATALQDPEAYNQQHDNSERLFELAQEQMMASEKIIAEMGRLQEILLEVQKQDIEESKKLEEQIRPLEKQLCSGICTEAEAARSDAAEKKIYDLRIKYCQKMSPLQTDALTQYLTGVKSILPDYRRLAEIQNELATLQNGVSYPVDMPCYAAIEEYTDVLLSAYQYRVGKFEE